MSILELSSPPAPVAATTPTATTTDPDESAATVADLDEFAATVAHEVGTPLAIVELAVETLLAHGDELGPGRTAELLRVAQRNSRLATSVLARLARARKVGAGAVHLEVEEVDLAQLARDTRSDLADAVLGRHPTTVHAPAPVVVTADPTALREVLSNLLTNAAKYSPAGSLVEIVVVGRAPWAQLTVRDRGPGMAAAGGERAFERYRQADADGVGVGLGLYVSRGLARAHGGDLTVRPASGGGSRFRLTLPLTR